jgi:hypothetical protein
MLAEYWLTSMVDIYQFLACTQHINERGMGFK